MQLTIIHGEDTKKSLESLYALIDKKRGSGYSVEKIKASDPKLRETLRSNSLFDDQRLFIVDNAQKFKKYDIEWLGELELESELVFYADKELKKNFLNKLPKHNEQNHKLPKVIWNFLESIHPGNAKSCIKMFHKLIENEPPQFVFEMIARQIRDVYWVKLDSDGYEGPSWKKAKLHQQAEKFSKKEITRLIDRLAEIDVQSKSSGDNISDLLDLLILSELK